MARTPSPQPAGPEARRPALAALSPQMATLAAIAAAGSFSAAADALGLNRAAVSKRIALLERELGLPVLTRTTRRVALTAAGSLLLARHGEAEALLQRALDEARHTLYGATGTVRVLCANSSLAVHLVGPTLFQFAQARPGIQVDLTSTPPAAASDPPDIELRLTDRPPEDRSARLLAKVDWAFQASADYIARHGLLRSPDRLGEHRFVVPAQHAGATTFVHTRSGATTSPAPAHAMTSNIQEVIFELVRRGEAIGLLPSYLSATSGRQAGLRTVLDGWRLERLPAQSLYAIHAPARYQRAATRAVIDHLQQVCRDTLG